VASVLPRCPKLVGLMQLHVRPCELLSAEIARMPEIDPRYVARYSHVTWACRDNGKEISMAMRRYAMRATRRSLSSNNDLLLLHAIKWQSRELKLSARAYVTALIIARLNNDRRSFPRSNLRLPHFRDSARCYALFFFTATSVTQLLRNV